MSPNDQRRPVGIVIASHGDLAGALLASAELIVGAQEHVTTACLGPQDNLETFHATLNTAIDQADGGAGVVVLIDLFGGTPGNAAALCAGQHAAPLPIVSGVNLPMLLEVLLSRNDTTPQDLAAHAIDTGHRGIVDVTAKLLDQIRASQSREA